MSTKGRAIGEKFKEKCKEKIRSALKQMTSQAPTPKRRGTLPFGLFEKNKRKAHLKQV